MNQSPSHRVLITVKAYAGNGGELLTKSIQGLIKFVDVKALSSIYKVNVEEDKAKTVHDLRSRASYAGLVVVVRGETSQPPEELLEQIKSLESELSSETLRRTLTLKLLVYDAVTLMTPELTLPHPEFHRRVDELVPASEVWGDYRHPILKESIFDLTRPYSGDEWGEFFAQGNSLLTN